MKKLASLIIFTLAFLVGCQDDNSILEPNNDLANSLNKGRPILSLDDDGSSSRIIDGSEDLTNYKVNYDGDYYHNSFSPEWRKFFNP